MNGGRTFLGLGLALAASGLFLAACAGGSSQIDRDPALGQYYTTEELAALSPAARNAYCRKMEQTLEELSEETKSYQVRLDSMQVMADTLRAQTIAMSDQIRQVNNELRELRLQRKDVDSYTTKEGDTLHRVARMLLGDPTRWSEIMEANKTTTTEDPEAVLSPGTVLKIPR